MTIKIELPATITFPMQRDAGDYELDIAKLTADTVASLIAAGARETSGNAGGTPKEGESNADAVRGCAARIQANEHNFGGGGGRKLSTVDVVAREWLIAGLVRPGANKLSRADADKLVKESLQDAFTTVAPKGDYEAFMMDVNKEATRRNKTKAYSFTVPAAE